MEQVDRASLMNVLGLTLAPLEERLRDEELRELGLLLAQMAQRYPAQDLSDSLESYLWDFEQLALKYSLPTVREALAALRIRPGRSFFPRPDEVAEEIEEQRAAATVRKDAERRAERRKKEIEEFWLWAPEWMEMTGKSEEELLKRFPSYKGTKRATSAPNA
ncbi:MAG TPA: hypothetical protein VGR47_05880 [Terracidiphilus sp.]|nr:hypothetical protein [Terracidiphilus sp.]